MEKHTVFTGYFGRDIMKKALVTREAFNWFLSNEVDSKFQSYTVTEGTGVWNGLQEECFILSVMVKGEVKTALAGHQLGRVARTYCKEFSQEAVLITMQDLAAVLVKL